MDILLLGSIVSLIGAAFCFCIAGAVKSERPAEDDADEMYAILGITPNHNN